MSTESLDRMPPHSEEAERGVLGSIIMDGQRVMDLCAEYRLQPASFYVPAHRTIFDALREMEMAGMAIDILTLVEHMKKSAGLDQCGGTVFLERLIDQTPTSAHAEYYVDIVARKWKLRDIISECRSTEASCFEPKQDEDPDGLMASHAQRMNAIDERQQQNEVTWADTVNESMATVEKLIETRTGLAGLSTGFKNLDKTLLGLRPACLYVLAARPSMGKTSLAMNIAENVALGVGDPEAKGHAVGIFSMEMDRLQLALRMKCSRAKVSSWRLARGFANQTDHQKLAQAAAVLAKAPIYMDDRGGLDIADIRFRARRWKRRYNIGLVIVDYLQLIHCREQARQGRQIEVGACASSLKEMAKELKVPVLALCQLSRATELRGDTGQPKLSDLRDSGQIEQDADAALMLRRPCKYPKSDGADDKTLAIVDVAKHRDGPTGEAWLNFHEDYTRFEDRARDIDNEMEYDGTERSRDEE